jgi:hypothetical protein
MSIDTSYTGKLQAIVDSDRKVFTDWELGLVGHLQDVLHSSKEDAKENSNTAHHSVKQLLFDKWTEMSILSSLSKKQINCVDQIYQQRVVEIKKNKAVEVSPKKSQEEDRGYGLAFFGDDE